ncbi:MAG TPA: 50S ribosomal protein L10 [Nitrospirota bacterium]
MAVQSGKKDKAKLVEELNDKFNRATSVILTDYKGLSVKDLSDIRNRLRGCSAEYKVVKNTLALRAAEGTGVKNLQDYFTGTTGVVMSYGEIVAPMKTLLDYSSKLAPFKLKAGVLEGAVLSPAMIKDVANLPSREVLISKALGGMMSPMFGLASTLHGVLRKFAYVMNAVKNSKEN